jgi:hypothetical protein
MVTISENESLSVQGGICIDNKCYDASFGIPAAIYQDINVAHQNFLDGKTTQKQFFSVLENPEIQPYLAKYINNLNFLMS